MISFFLLFRLVAVDQIICSPFLLSDHAYKMVSFLVCSPGDLDQISSGAQMSQLEHRDLLSLFVHQCDRADRANSINTEKLSKQEEDISSANQILLVKMNSVEFSMTSSKINGNQEIVFNGNCFTNVERTLIHFVCSLPYVSKLSLKSKNCTQVCNNS